VKKGGAAVIAHNCGTALMSLHQYGILNGDFALRNFVVNESGNVCIIALGRATSVSSIPDSDASVRLHHKRELLENGSLQRYGN